MNDFCAHCEREVSLDVAQKQITNCMFMRNAMTAIIPSQPKRPVGNEFTNVSLLENCSETIMTLNY